MDELSSHYDLLRSTLNDSCDGARLKLADYNGKICEEREAISTTITQINNCMQSEDLEEFLKVRDNLVAKVKKLSSSGTAPLDNCKLSVLHNNGTSIYFLSVILN